MYHTYKEYVLNSYKLPTEILPMIADLLSLETVGPPTWWIAYMLSGAQDTSSNPAGQAQRKNIFFLHCVTF